MIDDPRVIIYRDGYINWAACYVLGHYLDSESNRFALIILFARLKFPVEYRIRVSQISCSVELRLKRLLNDLGIVMFESRIQVMSEQRLDKLCSVASCRDASRVGQQAFGFDHHGCTFQRVVPSSPAEPHDTWNKFNDVTNTCYEHNPVVFLPLFGVFTKNR